MGFRFGSQQASSVCRDELFKKSWKLFDVQGIFGLVIVARHARLLSLLDDDLVGLQLVVIVVAGAVSGHLRGNRRSQRASLLLRACSSLSRRALHLKHVLV